MAAARKIVLFNVKFSPNLGDGVLSQCLEWGLAQAAPAAEITPVDLAGRTAFEPPSGSWKRMAAIAALQRLPQRLKDAAFQALLTRALETKIKPKIAAALAGADVAVFGGGQLIQDGDLNFPLKISAAARACAARKVPMAVFGVGVSRSRSPRGNALLRELLAAPSLAHLAVRDAQSQRNLAEYQAGDSRVCHDPGVLAARLWPVARAAADALGEGPPRIGVSVTHPSILRHHASGAHERVDHRAWFIAVIEALAAAGLRVVCFTNGAAEDEVLLAEVAATLRERPVASRVEVSPRPRDPEALCRLIGGLNAVIAHRLHANIVAFSYGVPHIGLKWDAKVDAFFDKVGRTPWLASAASLEPTEAVDRVKRLLEAPISDAQRAAVTEEAMADIARLADDLSRAAAFAGSSGAEEAPHVDG